MSHDRFPRPVRSFVANLFDFARHRFRQSSPSRPLSGNNNADSPMAGAISHVVAQQSSAIMTASASRAQDYLSPPPPTSPSPSPSPSPSRELLEDVPTAGIDPAPIRRQTLSPGIPRQTPSSTQGTSSSQAMGQGPFHQAHDFVVNNPLFVDISPDNFMASFLKETIIGAEFDSSDPNMPLRCHPGTRLKIIKRCQDFILDRGGRSKLRWVVGAAGVGKSAIMQSVARDECSVLSDIIIGATVFLSINGRQDGTKTVMTIAYQLAVKLNPYRRFAQREITDDPSLLRKSLPTQFEKFIVEPFIHLHILDPSSCLLIIIDGLDECAQTSTQQELLALISDLCITYPTSPIVWMIASRPEPHITSFFSRPKLALAYEKEEILVDSDDALEDVKRYLRDQFLEIQMASIALQGLPQWPSEDAFSKIAEASGGLFAYASTVIRYISDPTYGDPVSQLDDVLEIIKTGTSPNVSGEGHPMAQLDALYARILSRIPDKSIANAKKLLLLYSGEIDGRSFLFDCNILGMTESAAYGATHHIHSIAFVPRPNEAAKMRFRFFHKSFYDYLRDFQRSGFSPDITSEAQQLVAECASRIIEQAPDGVYIGGARDNDLTIARGSWTNGPGTGDNIPISWPAVAEHINRRLRLRMFRHAVIAVARGLANKDGVFCRPPCLRVLTTCFAKFPDSDGFLSRLVVSVFDETRRRELLDLGVLKHIPLEKLEYGHLWSQEPLRLRYRGPAAGLPDSWNTSCKHERERSWEDGIQGWSTNFDDVGICDYCFQRFTRHSKMWLPDHLVIFFNLDPQTCVVELRCVDPDDGVSEWIYHLLAKYKVGGEEV